VCFTVTLANIVLRSKTKADLEGDIRAVKRAARFVNSLTELEMICEAQQIPC
jgi:hypothetical protein